MAAGFSVKDALNKNSKAGIDESPRARFRTKDISIFKMYRNDMNFYSVEQIEELAGDILMYGLKQNLELVYAPCEMGEYRIVAGLLMVGGEILAKMTPPYNLTGKDFEKVGITFASSGNGYQKGTKSSRFGRIVNSIGGSSSTYTCDYFWWNAGITAVALVGGNCSNGDYCGVDYLNLNNSAGNANWNIGASNFFSYRSV